MSHRLYLAALQTMIQPLNHTNSLQQFAYKKAFRCSLNPISCAFPKLAQVKSLRHRGRLAGPTRSISSLGELNHSCSDRYDKSARLCVCVCVCSQSPRLLTVLLLPPPPLPHVLIAFSTHFPRDEWPGGEGGGAEVHKHSVPPSRAPPHLFLCVHSATSTVRDEGHSGL